MPTFIDTKQDTAHTTSYFPYQKISYLAPRYLPSTRYLTVASYFPPRIVSHLHQVSYHQLDTGPSYVVQVTRTSPILTYLTHLLYILRTAQHRLLFVKPIGLRTNQPTSRGKQPDLLSSEMRSDFAWRGKSARAAHRTSYSNR
jgi:hypothetical protein